VATGPIATYSQLGGLEFRTGKLGVEA